MKVTQKNVIRTLLMLLAALAVFFVVWASLEKKAESNTTDVSEPAQNQGQTGPETGTPPDEPANGSTRPDNNLINEDDGDTNKPVEDEIEEDNTREGSDKLDQVPEP